MWNTPLAERIRAADGDLVVLDTAPHSDSTALGAAKAADLILVRDPDGNPLEFIRYA